MVIRRAALSLSLALSIAGCASTPTRPAAAAPAAPTLSNGVTWVQKSAEYHALILQAYRYTTQRVETVVAGRQPGSWAVVLDADETVISNLVYQVERERVGLAYTTESWTAWVKRREAIPLPGAAAFLSRVRALGGYVAIVTNRLESECADTEAVFVQHQLVFDVILCRPDGSPSDKNPRFARVAAGNWPGARGPATVVAFVGDNILDFPALSQAIRTQGDGAFSAFGSEFFVMPNPMYGSWQ
jgi:5'-nucleotidase (lipoprotein e(P4) family)